MKSSNRFEKLDSDMNVLITGGAGYIGSHTVVELVKCGFNVHILDDFSNSSREVINRLEELLGMPIRFTEGSVLDGPLLKRILTQTKFDCVIHFAAFKAVGESVRMPLMYYQNNVVGTVELCRALQEFGPKSLVFSSSATVYGDSSSMPLSEDSPLQTPLNPYGRSKFMMEQILSDLGASDNDWDISILRYFNPVGAHNSGLIGEDPKGEPNNLMPYITQVAVGKREKLLVFGGDYPTRDGTGVRDFIHVKDLALGHVAAVRRLVDNHKKSNRSVDIFNLGTGKGYSVKELIAAFERTSGKRIPYEVVERREGDVAECWANPLKARELLNWESELDLHDMCRDAWRWQSKNPKGYAG